ncbi:DeoR family transcriptional regulator, partial [Listeria monocytogenes]|uniref:DeoR family transcriptional regulator n=1 Tax=Listeria monocytogenes TaxID=1639 RepID=UPI003FA49408
MDDQTALTDRQRRIVEIVRELGFATVEALAREFDFSAQTVRRDIIFLDERELLQRFHGGAGLRETTVR